MSRRKMLACIALASAAGACAQPPRGIEPAAQPDALVRVSGTVVERSRAWPPEGVPHDLMKIRTREGRVLLVDLGVPGGEGTLAEGDRVTVVGAPTTAHGQSLLFAHHVFGDTIPY